MSAQPLDIDILLEMIELVEINLNIRGSAWTQMLKSDRSTACRSR